MSLLDRFRRGARQFRNGLGFTQGGKGDAETQALREELERVRGELREAGVANEDLVLQLYVLRAHHQRTVRVADEARSALQHIEDPSGRANSLKATLDRQLAKSAVLAPPPAEAPGLAARGGTEARRS